MNKIKKYILLMNSLSCVCSGGGTTTSRSSGPKSFTQEELKAQQANGAQSASLVDGTGNNNKDVPSAALGGGALLNNLQRNTSGNGGAQSAALVDGEGNNNRVGQSAFLGGGVLGGSAPSNHLQQQTGFTGVPSAVLQDGQDNQRAPVNSNLLQGDSFKDSGGTNRSQDQINEQGEFGSFALGYKRGVNKGHSPNIVIDNAAFDVLSSFSGGGVFNLYNFEFYKKTFFLDIGGEYHQDRMIHGIFRPNVNVRDWLNVGVYYNGSLQKNSLQSLANYGGSFLFVLNYIMISPLPCLIKGGVDLSGDKSLYIRFVIGHATISYKLN